MGSRFNYQWVRNIPQALAGTLSDLSMELTTHSSFLSEYAALKLV
jgi:hypothetical protein